jgi:hypothetical protein
MSSFISNVLQDVASKHKKWENITFILPSQRACVFLKQEVLKIITKASFLPRIISVEEYIQGIADIQLVDNTQLLFEFYSIYKENTSKENWESFDVFAQWATIALHDFNEVDSFLVNAKDFFKTLKDIKQLDSWFQNKSPSNLAVQYLKFFESLYTYYEALYNRLLNHKFGYQGLIYREAINNLEYFIQNNSQNEFIFVGFNALNKAEEYIFQELLNNKIAKVYWDVNESILNPDNEAGMFLRKYKNEWSYYKSNPFLGMSSHFNSDRKIQIIGTPKNTTQVKYVGELLSKQIDFEKTALILADEKLVGPMLNSLPSKVKNINITMGYPLKDIQVANLFSTIFKLHLNQKKFNKESKLQFYYKDILNLLNDPYINRLQGNLIQKLIGKIKKENRIFLSLENLKIDLPNDEIERLEDVFMLFDFSLNMNEIIKKCVSLLQKLKVTTEGIEKEYLFRFYRVFQQLFTLNSNYNHIGDLKTLILFYEQILNSEKLSFRGEPLRGLQLMGMLESRVLDFKTLILTSVNEGVLPKGKNEVSFIPFDVKKHYGLPTFQEKDAIYSYHFQRLIKRAKNVYLLYNTETDNVGSGEKSRFLTQLEISNLVDESLIVSPKVQPINFPEIRIEKTEVVMEKLRKEFSKGISPSALATYVYNPIAFYEQKILGIRDLNEVEETVALNTMGTIIHDVLDEMYKPHIGVFLREEDILAMIGIMKMLLLKYFKKHYKEGNIETGKNKLIFEVSKNYIHRFLKQELKLLQEGGKLKILATEEKLLADLYVDGVDFPIKIKGIVDRIDELDGIVRIIDYKTGKVDRRQLKVNEFGLVRKDFKYTKAMQVMLYSYLYTSKTLVKLGKLESGIISFKNLNAGFLKMNFSEKRVEDNLISIERIQEFMEEIQLLIKEILNPETPFIENKNLPF